MSNKVLTYMIWNLSKLKKTEFSVICYTKPLKSVVLQEEKVKQI